MDSESPCAGGKIPTFWPDPFDPRSRLCAGERRVQGLQAQAHRLKDELNTNVRLGDNF